MVYSTPAKAWENADPVGSELHMWNCYEQRKGTLAGRKDIWSVPMAWPSWGRVRFAPNMDTQKSQKGDSDLI